MGKEEGAPTLYFRGKIQRKKRNRLQTELKDLAKQNISLITLYSVPENQNYSTKQLLPSKVHGHDRKDEEKDYCNILATAESKISRDLAMELTSSASKLQMEDINLG